MGFSWRGWFFSTRYTAWSEKKALAGGIETYKNGYEIGVGYDETGIHGDHIGVITYFKQNCDRWGTLAPQYATNDCEDDWVLTSARGYNHNVNNRSVYLVQDGKTVTRNMYNEKCLYKIDYTINKGFLGTAKYTVGEYLYYYRWRKMKDKRKSETKYSTFAYTQWVTGVGFSSPVIVPPHRAGDKTFTITADQAKEAWSVKTVDYIDKTVELHKYASYDVPTVAVSGTKLTVSFGNNNSRYHLMHYIYCGKKVYGLIVQRGEAISVNVSGVMKVKDGLKVLAPNGLKSALYFHTPSCPKWNGANVDVTRYDEKGDKYTVATEKYNYFCRVRYDGEVVKTEYNEDTHEGGEVIKSAINIGNYYDYNDGGASTCRDFFGTILLRLQDEDYGGWGEDHYKKITVELVNSTQGSDEVEWSRDFYLTDESVVRKKILVPYRHIKDVFVFNVAVGEGMDGNGGVVTAEAHNLQFRISDDGAVYLTSWDENTTDEPVGARIVGYAMQDDGTTVPLDVSVIINPCRRIRIPVYNKHFKGGGTAVSLSLGDYGTFRADSKGRITIPARVRGGDDVFAEIRVAKNGKTAKTHIRWLANKYAYMSYNCVLTYVNDGYSADDLELGKRPVAPTFKVGYNGFGDVLDGATNTNSVFFTFDLDDISWEAGFAIDLPYTPYITFDRSRGFTWIRRSRPSGDKYDHYVSGNSNYVSFEGEDAVKGIDCPTIEKALEGAKIATNSLYTGMFSALFEVSVCRDAVIAFGDAVSTLTRRKFTELGKTVHVEEKTSSTEETQERINTLRHVVMSSGGVEVKSSDSVDGKYDFGVRKIVRDVNGGYRQVFAPTSCLECKTKFGIQEYGLFIEKAPHWLESDGVEITRRTTIPLVWMIDPSTAKSFFEFSVERVEYGQQRNDPIYLYIKFSPINMPNVSARIVETSDEGLTLVDDSYKKGELRLILNWKNEDYPKTATLAVTTYNIELAYLKIKINGRWSNFTYGDFYTGAETDDPEPSPEPDPDNPSGGGDGDGDDGGDGGDTGDEGGSGSGGDGDGGDTGDEGDTRWAEPTTLTFTGDGTYSWNYTPTTATDIHPFLRITNNEEGVYLDEDEGEVEGGLGLVYSNCSVADGVFSISVSQKFKPAIEVEELISTTELDNLSIKIPADTDNAFEVSAEKTNVSSGETVRFTSAVDAFSEAPTLPTDWGEFGVSTGTTDDGKYYADITFPAFSGLYRNAYIRFWYNGVFYPIRIMQTPS